VIVGCVLEDRDGQRFREGATNDVGESVLSAVEVVLEDVDEDGFNGNPAVFVAFAADLDDGAAVGAAQVADVGAQQLDYALVHGFRLPLVGSGLCSGHGDLDCR
jgi:hypothetical protein